MENNCSLGKASVSSKMMDQFGSDTSMTEYWDITLLPSYLKIYSTMTLEVSVLRPL